MQSLFLAWYVIWRFQRFPKETAFCKVLSDKAFKIASALKYDGYQHWIELTVCNCFDKKAGDNRTQTGTRTLRINNWLVNYTVPLLENLKGVKCTHCIWDNIWNADLGYIHLISK